MNVLFDPPLQISTRNRQAEFDCIWKAVPEAPKGRHRATRLKRVLVVDDDDAVRETLADLLDVDNYEPIQAVDAAQALMILLEDPTAIDVLVTDLSMPGTDGIALIKHARRIKPNLPAVLLTGYAEEVSTVAMDTNGGFHVLRKPVESANLIQQIAALLSQSVDG